MSMHRTHDAGLSLIEVLVSLAIFAVIGVAGLTVLSTVARTGEQTEGRLERLAEVDRAFLVIRRDLAQSMGGDVKLVDNVLSFARASEDQSLNITYLTEEDTLLRKIQGVAATPVDQHLLFGTAAAQWRLLDGARRWHDQWPPIGSDGPVRPTAAELQIGIWRAGAERPTSVTRLMLLPAGQGR